MNVVTIILAALIVLGALRGYSRGLVAMALGIAALIVAAVVAHAAAPGVATWLDQQFRLGYHIRSALDAAAPASTAFGLTVAAASTVAQAIVSALAFLGLVILIEVVLGGILVWIGRIPNHLPVIGLANRTAGAALGLVEAGAVAAFAMLLVVPMAKAGSLGPVSPMVLQSGLALWLQHVAHGAAPVLKKLP